MSTHIHFMVPGEPQPLKRHRYRVREYKGRPQVLNYDPKENKNAKAEIAWCAKQAMAKAGLRALLDEPLVLEAWYWRRKPKGVKRKYPCVKPDSSNYTKMVEDALNDVLWVDDGLIVDTHTYERYDSENPRTEITVRSVEDA